MLRELANCFEQPGVVQRTGAGEGSAPRRNAQPAHSDGAACHSRSERKISPVMSESSAAYIICDRLSVLASQSLMATCRISRQ